MSATATHPAIPALVDALADNISYRTILIEHQGDAPAQPFRRRTCAE